MRALQLLIKGKVQGVFFRATAKEVADKLGLKGWVKNTLDGDVEAFIIGDDKEVQLFIEWSWKGPQSAHVAAVIVKDAVEQPLDKFRILR